MGALSAGPAKEGVACGVFKWLRAWSVSGRGLYNVGGCWSMPCDRAQRGVACEVAERRGFVKGRVFLRQCRRSLGGCHCDRALFLSARGRPKRGVVFI